MLASEASHPQVVALTAGGAGRLICPHGRKAGEKQSSSSIDRGACKAGTSLAYKVGHRRADCYYLMRGASRRALARDARPGGVI
jgi:hypothetical protein